LEKELVASVVLALVYAIIPVLSNHHNRNSSHNTTEHTVCGDTRRKRNVLQAIYFPASV
jgi:hypothetical protein